MNLNQAALNDFISYVVVVMNNNIYDELKAWVSEHSDYDDYDKNLDYFIDNLEGELTWTND